MNYLTTQYNQQQTTRLSPASSENTMLNPDTKAFIPRNNLQFNGTYVRETPPTFSSYDNGLSSITPGNSQLDSYYVQVTGEGQFYNSSQNPIGYVAGYQGCQPSSAFIQNTGEGQFYNSSQNPIGYVAGYQGCQPGSAFIQNTGEGQFYNSSQNPIQYVAGHEGYQHGSDFIQNTAEGQFYNSSQNPIQYVAGYQDCQPGSAFIQNTAEGQFYNSSQNPIQYVAGYQDCQPGSAFIQNTAEGQFYNSSQNPIQYAADHEGYQHGSDFIQNTAEGQFYNSSQNPIEYAASNEGDQPDSAYVQATVEEQNSKSYPAHAESAVSFENPQLNFDFDQLGGTTQTPTSPLDNEDVNFIAECCSVPSRAPIQTTEELQNFNFWPTPAELAANPKSYKPNSAPIQAAEELQNFNFWPTPAELAANPKSYKPNSAPIQAAVEKQKANSLSTHTATGLISFTGETQQQKLKTEYEVSPIKSHPPQKRTQKNTPKYTPTAPRFAYRTSHLPSQQFTGQQPQRNLETDEAVDNFIIQVKKLNSLNSRDISWQITMTFHKFNNQATCLTDDHRKKLLIIIPNISKLIDRKDLNNISIVNILLSLAKTKFCNKLNSNSTSENECIKYEHACKNLIAKILDKIQTYKHPDNRHWSNIFNSMKLISEQSLDLIDPKTINNLVVKFNMEKHSITRINAKNISIMLISLYRLIKFNKLDSRLPATYYSIEYLVQKLETATQGFSSKSINNAFFSISKLAKLPEFTKLISDKPNLIPLLLQEVIKNKSSDWNELDVSLTLYGIGNLLSSTYTSEEIRWLTREAYKVLYYKIPSIASNITVQASHLLLSGVIKLILSNKITCNKPSKDIVQRIFLDKIIADPSIINNKELYDYLHTISFYHTYLTSDDIIKIMEGVNFTIPDINYLKSYFISMGSFLVKIRNEIANDKTNEKLLALEKRFTTEIKKAWHYVQSNIKRVDQETITAINNTCSLIDEITDLTLLQVSYPDVKGSQLEDECLAIIKTLIPPHTSLNREYHIDNIPPVDACLIYPDGSMLAIEIQGPGHYVDDNGEYPSGRHLFKMERLKMANIKVLEIHYSKLMNHINPIETAEYFINLFVKNNIEIRPEYRFNALKLLRDSGFPHNKSQTT